MDGSEAPLKDTVGILIFSKRGDGTLYSIALQNNTQTWTYFGGDKLEGEPDIVAAQRWVRDSLGMEVSTDDLVPFARTTDVFGRCAFFALGYSGHIPGPNFALSQVANQAADMAMDVPVLIEMAKLALMFPDDIFFTAEMR